MITSRKTQQEVRMQLDKLDLELLRRVIREELEAHERRLNPPKYVGYQIKWCECGKHTGPCNLRSCGHFQW